MSRYNSASSIASFAEKVGGYYAYDCFCGPVRAKILKRVLGEEVFETILSLGEEVEDRLFHPINPGLFKEIVTKAGWRIRGFPSPGCHDHPGQGEAWVVWQEPGAPKTPHADLWRGVLPWEFVIRELIRPDHELVLLLCKECGHTWEEIMDDPADREHCVECPACGSYYPEYVDIAVDPPRAVFSGTRVYYKSGRVIDLAELS